MKHFFPFRMSYITISESSFTSHPTYNKISIFTRHLLPAIILFYWFCTPTEANNFTNLLKWKAMIDRSADSTSQVQHHKIDNLPWWKESILSDASTVKPTSWNNQKKKKERKRIHWTWRSNSAGCVASSLTGVATCLHSYSLIPHLMRVLSFVL